MKSIKFTRGFTLLELVIAIAVVGIISAVGLYAYTGALKKGRDARRKSDLKQIQTALQAFYADYGRYPSTWNAWDHYSTNAQPWLYDNHPSGVNFSFTSYIPTIPVDPKNNGVVAPVSPNNYSYGYHTDANGTCYVLLTRLENPNDSAQNNSIPASDGGGCAAAGPDAGILWIGNP